MNAAETTRGLWVYAVGRELEATAVRGVPGVDAAPADLVREGDLTAVVSPVDLERFGADGLRRAFNDLDRLEQIARTHHRVVQAAAERPVVPMRMATVYDDEAGVRRMLAGNSDLFVTVLRRVEGRQEWGVKAFAAAAVTTPDRPAPTSGTDYLRRRQASLSTAEASRRASSAEAEAVYATLTPAAVAARQHRPQDPHLSGDRRPMLLNAAFLLDDGAAEAFAGLVRDVARTHGNLDIELTGPWAPYSFAEFDPASVSATAREPQ